MGQFLNPYYLFAALGLLIPLLIHLWNRQRARVQKTGSIQWLIEAEITRVNRIQFHDITRFILRASIIIVFVLILMELVLPREATRENPARRWLLVEPALPARDFVKIYADSLEKLGWEVHFLMPGFPRYDHLDSLWQKGNVFDLDYWALLKDLEQSEIPLDSIILLSQRKQVNFQGKLPQIQLSLKWQTLPPEKKPDIIYAARDLGNDSLEVVLGHREESIFHLENKTIPKDAPAVIGYRLDKDSLYPKNLSLAKVPIEKRDSLKCIIYYQKGFEKDVATLTSAWQALGEYLKLNIEINASTLSDQSKFLASDFIFILSKDPFKDRFSSLPGKQIIYREQPQKALISRADAQRSIYELNHRLDPKLNPEIIEENLLPLALLRLLPNYEAKTKGLDKYDHRKMEVASLGISSGQNQSAGSAPLQKTRSLRFYLGLGLFLMILGERYWDYFGKTSFKHEKKGIRE